MRGADEEEVPGEPEGASASATPTSQARIHTRQAHVPGHGLRLHAAADPQRPVPDQPPRRGELSVGIGHAQ